RTGPFDRLVRPDCRHRLDGPHIERQRFSGVRENYGYHFAPHRESGQLSLETAAHHRTRRQTEGAGDTMNIERLTGELSIRRQLADGTAIQLEAVKEIIQQVKTQGDAALMHFAKKWDRAELSSLRVTKEEIE